MSRFEKEDLPEPPKNSIHRMSLDLGLSAFADLVRRKGENEEIDRFVMVEDEEDERRANLAVALGVVKEKQDGAVLVDNQEENDFVWGDVLTEEGEWDMERINKQFDT